MGERCAPTKSFRLAMMKRGSNWKNPNCSEESLGKRVGTKIRRRTINIWDE